MELVERDGALAALAYARDGASQGAGQVAVATREAPNLSRRQRSSPPGDPSLRARLGREARASAAAHSIDRVTGELVALFDDVVRSGR